MRTALLAVAALAVTAAGPVSLTDASGAVGNSAARASVSKASVSSASGTKASVSSAGVSKASAARATKVVKLSPSTSGNNPEGVAWDPRSRSFFVGTVGTGTIYRATLGARLLRPFITPSTDDPADSAVGMKVAHGKLYVAGGPTGSIYVYATRTGRLLARFETGRGGFLNDLVVTRQGDVYVTDSFRPILWHLTPGMVMAGRGTPRRIHVGPEIAYTPNKFNLNGIVTRRDGRELIVVNSFSMSLFRIDLNRRHPAARTITKINAPKLAGDGLLIDRGQLLVVTGDPARVTVLNLSRHDLRARVARVLTDRTLHGPSTIARAEDRYLVVNADFAKNAQPYTVSSLPRR